MRSPVLFVHVDESVGAAAEAVALLVAGEECSLEFGRDRRKVYAVGLLSSQLACGEGKRRWRGGRAMS